LFSTLRALEPEKGTTMAMLSKTGLELQPGVRTSFGAGIVEKLGKRVTSRAHERAFIVTDKGVVGSGVIDRVEASLKKARIRSRVFDGVTSNPTSECVQEGSALLKADPRAVVIAVGGGSTLDAAKAIALIAPNGGTPADFPFGCRPGKAGHPIIAVPTTAGTGSETNMFGVVTDTEKKRKVLLGHPSVLPKLVLLDPELTLRVPAPVTATCGMDVLTHAIEAFTCTRVNPMSDAAALRAIAMVQGFLPAAFDDGMNLEARSQMLFASHLAGIAFTSSGLGMCHAMGHPLSARLDAAHGQSLATLLPLVMHFNLELSAARYAQVAIAMGAADPGASDADNARRAIGAVEALRARVGTDKPGRALGIDAEMIPTLVEDAFADPLMAATPRYPEPEDVTQLYRDCL